MPQRVSFTELLCVHCPEAHRGYVWSKLRELHPGATVTRLDNGWLVVESSLGSPQSPLLGSSLCVRFSLGEQEVLGADIDTRRAHELARLAVERPRELGNIHGDFSFVVLGEQGAATVVRSCSGAPRLFTFKQDALVVVGTRLEWVARMFPRGLTLDAQRLACDDHALGVAPHDSSAITGISIVPVGHVAHIGRWATARVVRYWHPETLPPVYLKPDALATEIGARLREELSRHLDPSHSNALLFSGGLDSSLLTALCRDLGAPLDGVTILPPHQHPALPRERYYARTLSAVFTTHVVRHLDADWLLEAITQHPGTLCSVASSEWQALSSLERAPSTVITGWFADECFGHVRMPELFRRTLPGWGTLRACAPRDAFAQWYRRRRAGRSPFQTDGLAASALFSPKAVTEFQGWMRAVTWPQRPEGRAERLLLYRRLTDIAGAYAEAAAHMNARVIAPFASRAVVELAAQLEPAQLFERGLAKAPLRNLARRHLARAHAERPDKGDWGLAPKYYPRPSVPSDLAHVLDMDYLQAHPMLLLDEVGTLLWVTALERGRARIEHERKAIWNR